MLLADQVPVQIQLHSNPTLTMGLGLIFKDYAAEVSGCEVSVRVYMADILSLSNFISHTNIACGMLGASDSPTSGPCLVGGVSRLIVHWRIEPISRKKTVSGLITEIIAALTTCWCG